MPTESAWHQKSAQAERPTEGRGEAASERRRDEAQPSGHDQKPLSPLLANVLLDEVDRELERRGHKFVRYADDCNVYVKSERAGQRVLQGLRACYAKLRLKGNETKTAVAPVWGRKFLGYKLWAAPQGQVKMAVAGEGRCNATSSASAR